jgi:prepilin-type N-terminal cleavage/methylation domain-containing protein
MIGRHQRGFTVLEIMISLVVMSIGIVALYSLQVVAIDGNTTAQEFTQARTLAQRFAETLRRDAISWTTVANLPASLRRQGVWLDADPANPDPGKMVNKDFLTQSAGVEVLDPRYCVKYRVDTVPPGVASPRIVRIDLRVVWPRRERSRTAFQNCPDNMLAADQIRTTWTWPLTTLLYRHEDAR